ncbi:hypothetical protein LTR28_006709 [Elasticomyces elasticus]|nr:hypothetical protein LTR28_006709 [Elasticomyces elasticus]
MAQPQPSQRQPLPEETNQYATLTHNFSIFLLVACPTLALLPPRKLDFYTIGLIGSAGLSANYLLKERTGKGVWQYVSRSRTAAESSTNLPTERAREFQRRLREERAAREAHDRALGVGNLEETEKHKGILERVWMGDEKEGWKERRMMEEREAFEEGKSLWDIMIDQIWEVWNWKGPNKASRESVDGDE